MSKNAINPDDKNFYNHTFQVWLHEHDTETFVYANNASEAIDIAIDYAEAQGWEGCFLSHDDIAELELEGYLEEHICGGNHCRYLSSLNAGVKRVR